jgi:hypothetical protein
MTYMRSYTGWALAAVLAVGTALRADDRDALKVVAEAVKAHGGEDALAKMKTVERKSAGQLVAAGKEVPFSEDYIAQLPGRWRRATEMRAGSQDLRVLVVVNGDKGWQSTGGAVSDIGAERLKELRADGYAQWLTTLLPLQRDASLGLAPLPEVKVNGEPAQGVKVASKGRADVKLYFDKKTHLLVQMEHQAADGGESAAWAETYSGHKDFDGVKLPTKIVRMVGGKKAIDITEAKYTFPAKIEDATFGKP